MALGVGDKLAVALTFSLSGFAGDGQDVRFGVFDSQGTRNSTNLTGGMNDATFINDTGYGLDFYASGSGSPFVIARRATLNNANVFNSFGDFVLIAGSGATSRQPLVDDTSYTLSYVIERLTRNDTRISTEVSGGALSDLSYSAVETSPSPNASFDYFAFRIGGTNFTKRIAFTELFVQYSPGRYRHEHRPSERAGARRAVLHRGAVTRVIPSRPFPHSTGVPARSPAAFRPGNLKTRMCLVSPSVACKAGRAGTTLLAPGGA